MNGTINDETSETFTKNYTVSVSLCRTVFADGSSRQLFLLDDDLQDRIKSVPYMLTTTTTVNQKLPIQDILDRLDVTVNIEKADKELANETKYEEGEVLYPTDWAVIETWLLGEKSFSRLEAMVFSVVREREREKIIAVPRVRLYWSLSS